MHAMLIDTNIIVETTESIYLGKSALIVCIHDCRLLAPPLLLNIIISSEGLTIYLESSGKDAKKDESCFTLESARHCTGCFLLKS